jgi:tripartite-type tricarboxylate transporter receptor subunit TctC
VDTCSIPRQRRVEYGTSRPPYRRGGGFNRLGTIRECGRIPAACHLGAARTHNWPHVPTLKESGIDIVSNSPYGIAGPAGMEPQVTKILHDTLRNGMLEPAYEEALNKLDQESFYLDSAAYRDYAQRELAEQKELVELLKLKLN